MKINEKDRESIARQLQLAQKKQGLRVAEISRLSRVDSGQTSRILRGEFRTLSHSVVEICRVLGVRVAFVKTPIASTVNYERMITDSAIRAWDKTPEGATRLVRLLNDLRILQSGT